MMEINNLLKNAKCFSYTFLDMAYWQKYYSEHNTMPKK